MVSALAAGGGGARRIPSLAAPYFAADELCWNGRAIARARNLPAECIVPGAGSSALIFLCFRESLNENSRILLLDPTYALYSLTNASCTARWIACR